MLKVSSARLRRSALFLGLALPALVACAPRDDLAEPPVPLGDFVLGHNVAVTDKIQKVPISRDATGGEWEVAMEKAIADRFGRYSGSRVYNIGISVDAYALAPPGVPVVLKPKSALVITANIWDDAVEKKLNEKGEQITVFEGMSGETLVGSGLTRTREQQMEILAYNAAKAVEAWLLKHPEWFSSAPSVSATAEEKTPGKTAAENPAE